MEPQSRMLRSVESLKLASARGSSRSFSVKRPRVGLRWSLFALSGDEFPETHCRSPVLTAEGFLGQSLVEFKFNIVLTYNTLEQERNTNVLPQPWTSGLSASLVQNSSSKAFLIKMTHCKLLRMYHSKVSHWKWNCYGESFYNCREAIIFCVQMLCILTQKPPKK